MSRSLEEIQEDISRARVWARERFNAYVDEETTPSHIMAPITFEVTFPEPDEMAACPVVYGRTIPDGHADYYLCWIGEGLFWKGGFSLRPDIVTKMEVK